MSADDTPDKSGQGQERPEEPEKKEQRERPEPPAGEPGERAEAPAGPERERPEPEPEEPGAEKPGAGASPPGEPGPEGAGPGPVPPKEAAPGAVPLTGRQRLMSGLWPPRLTRAQLTVAVLLCVLGLGLAIQVRSTSDNSALRGARQEDLVRILDELDNRTKRLEDEKRKLESQRSELESSSNQAAEARKQTAQKEEQLGVLAGTVAAEGPGIELTVSDSKGSVEADKLLDTIQELRAAGAEAIQINDVRVVASTYFSGSAGKVEIDGKKVSQPYKFKVIGKPQDLEPALNIPGGVVQTLEKEQASVSVSRSEKIIVDALRPAKRPDYARSSSQ
ncbi:DUF881 domain-containing protein [Streptomyces sp. UNOB3_S3]|uniref:DUF881 domain-containing protein n=1 Tax=Streptomyces sp. UNOB3_S3 TaxID=2871682 RepID=UPI001E564AB7|nr:DUF881 domain-containing protein [Streptomyces sp. UNOB3_S3]MCC3776887.1 DUF881 domain-containing protein [Streptomyces sp. UNOB3_S3]